MSKVSYVALYPTDFLADIGHLGNTELGIYTRLLLVYYRDQRPLPYDNDKLRRIAMTFSPEECKAMNEVLAEFFVAGSLSDGTRVWRHTRADRELERANESRNARIKRTEAARSARWNGKASVTESVTESVTSYSQTENQNQNQNQIEEKEKKESRQGKSGVRPPLDLPEWLSAGSWQDWHAYRLARKGWTRRAQELSLQTLAQLRNDGHDPQRVIDQSIERGWSGLFPVAVHRSAGGVTLDEIAALQAKYAAEEAREANAKL